jgi:tetratricopeptide (TPR) repeat protein
MNVSLPLCLLLGITAVSLGTILEPWFQSWAGSRTSSKNLLQVALGDSRRLFAKQMFAKADAYFHNGYYPSIYDSQAGYEEAHLAKDVNGSDQDEEAEANFLGKPTDWIDRFSRNFYAARHTHLGDSACGHSGCEHGDTDHQHDANCEHDHAAEPSSGANLGLERELLPWLRLSAALDPEQPQTYVVTAFWLRQALNKVDEAEQFLREGLQANPGNYEILFELGRIYYEHRNDPTRAHNVWELALQNWKKYESDKAEPNILLHAQILAHLAKLEEREENYPKALEHLAELQTISPNKDSIQSWMDEIKAKLP